MVPLPLYFIDPKSLFEAFLNSDIVTNMYKGMAHFVDNLIELYYTLYWSSLVRTILGEYAYFMLYAYNKDIGKPIFPSDFIYFRCIDYYRCYCGFDEDDPNCMMHIGRVKAVGKDYTTAYIYEEGDIILIINECIDIK